MSWLFSLALAAESLGGGFSGGEPCAPSSENPTPQAYLSLDRMTDYSRLSRFGMTFAPLTADRGEAVLMSYLAAFPARTYPSPEKAQASPESVPASGPTWRASLAKFDPDTCSWKTAQLSLFEGSASSSPIWPRSGMTAAGQCWELPMSGRRTSATDSGLWQTPVADDSANRKAGKWNSRGEPKLSAQVMSPDLWPTPTVCGNYNRKGSSKASGDGLATAVAKFSTPTASMADRGGRGDLLQQVRGNESPSKRWPTPNARDWKDSGPTQGNRKSPNLGTQAGGQLNPTWVEWLMGWPLGWTDLKPLETDRCQPVLQPHGDYSRANGG